MTSGLKNFFTFLLVAMVLLSLCLNSVLWHRIDELQDKVAGQQTQRQYVYDTEKLVKGYTLLAEVQKNFEKQISDLNVKVNEARQKLEKMSDKKAKEEYATVYVSSLSLQRDQLLEQYQNNMKTLNEKVNQALVNVANEKNLPYVLDAKSIVVTTGAVVDVTDDVLKKLQ